jgi:SAM-dependent methyltransferase
VAIVQASDPAIAGMSDAARDRVFQECYRVLRSGGRLIVMTAAADSGVAALLRRRRPTIEVASERILASLEHGGFRASRLLAERAGARFFEGLKA